MGCDVKSLKLNDRREESVGQFSREELRTTGKPENLQGHKVLVFCLVF